MLSIHECLLKAKKGGSHNFLISEKEDWKGDLTRLVLKDSENAGLVLVRMLAGKPLDVVEGKVPDGDEDVEPEMEGTSSEDHPPVNIEWSDSWDRFYISKNDDWHHVAVVINEFCQEVNHTMNVDAESAIPPTAPPPSSSTSSPFGVIEVQKLLSGGSSVRWKDERRKWWGW